MVVTEADRDGGGINTPGLDTPVDPRVDPIIN